MKQKWKNKGKIVFLVIVVMLAASSCNPNIRHESVTIYTPKGTAVSAFRILQEMTSSQIQECNNYVGETYPHAERLRDATSMYNCHSYAWYNQSTSNTIWIDQPEQQKFWTDGSYCCVASSRNTVSSSAAYFSKIRYVNDDHSAIKTTQNDVASKWGPYGLYRHKPDDCPYDASLLYYYES